MLVAVLKKKLATMADDTEVVVNIPRRGNERVQEYKRAQVRVVRAVMRGNDILDAWDVDWRSSAGHDVVVIE